MNLAPIPSTIVTLDFESYYSKDYNLRKLTTEGYVRDARFEVIGVSVAVGARPAVWMEEHDFRQWAARFPWGRVAVLAQHAHLEGLVLSHHYNIRPGFWLDTLSMSRLVNGPGGPTGKGHKLEVLAPFYGVGTKGDDLEKTKGKRRRDFTAAEWLEFGAYGRNDVDLTRGVYPLMVTQVPLSELHLIDATIRMFSEPTFRANQDVLREALAQERAKKRTALLALSGAEWLPERLRAPPEELTAVEREALESARGQLASSEKFAALLKGLGVGPPTKQNPKGEMIYAFAKSDPGMHELLEHENPEVQALAEARLAVKSVIGESRMERFLDIAKRGAFPIYLKHAGAHTHRSSGGDSQNAQNLNRGGALRAALEAPPGEELVVADSGQIEARVTAELAGEKAALETFRRNDLKNARYLAARAPLVAALGREPTKEENKQIDRELKARGIEDGDFYADKGSMYFRKPLSKNETPVERQTAKSMELGLGFGMGTMKFGTELLKGMLGAPPVQFGSREVLQYGVDVFEFEQRPYGRSGETNGQVLRMLTTRLPYGELLPHMAVTDYFVRLYRSTNSRIAQLWRTMESLLERMSRPDGEAVFGPLRVEHERVWFPNGTFLRYDKLRRTGDGYRYWGYKDGRMQWTKIYGGLFTENVVQKIARDIVLGEQALIVRAAGYRLVTTTHDELVCSVPEGRGAECLAFMLKTMKTAPAWCQGLPLNASGGVARSYGAVK